MVVSNLFNSKKAQFVLGIGTVMAVFIAIALLVFLFSGGFSAISTTSKLLSSIPAWAWVAVGALFLIKLIR